MKKTCLTVAAGAILAMGLSASADVINFDDLVGQASVPPGYGGVSNWYGWQYYDWAQPPYNPSSEPCRVYPTGGTGQFDFAADVTFDGAFFNGYGTGHGFDPIYMELFSGGSLVHTSAVIDLDGSGVGQWLDSGYAGSIDSVNVVGYLGYFIMDDVTTGEAGFSVDTTGDCPGTMEACAHRANPGDRIVIAYGFAEGSSGPVPGCSGLYVGIQRAKEAARGNADANGDFCARGRVPAGACGRVVVQAVNLSTCEVSNLAYI
ncbi:MAG: hypothetical protein D8M59_01235 [Planctomycetes bacterium]|nr:hypothetical protein [Planctomycetota bacterium]NOG54658.1 hypothetical protein [Planctomycetota bacterium]